MAVTGAIWSEIKERHLIRTTPESMLSADDICCRQSNSARREMPGEKRADKLWEINPGLGGSSGQCMLNTGVLFQYKTFHVFPGIGIPIIKIRFDNHLIFIKGNNVQVRRCFTMLSTPTHLEFHVWLFNTEFCADSLLQVPNHSIFTDLFHSALVTVLWLQLDVRGFFKQTTVVFLS